MNNSEKDERYTQNEYYIQNERYANEKENCYF